MYDQLCKAGQTGSRRFLGYADCCACLDFCDFSRYNSIKRELPGAVFPGHKTGAPQEGQGGTGVEKILHWNEIFHCHFAGTDADHGALGLQTDGRNSADDG